MFSGYPDPRCLDLRIGHTGRIAGHRELVVHLCVNITDPPRGRPEEQTRQNEQGGLAFFALIAAAGERPHQKQRAVKGASALTT
jgi:hypothetical protein